MIELVFGIFWTVFTAIFTVIFYFVFAVPIEYSEELFSQEAFSTLLLPKLFIGFFWVIGLLLIFVGLKKVIRNIKTEKYGEICYGKIVDIFESGARVNHVPELKALVTVYIESTGTIEEVEEIIGLATSKKYKIGDYIEGKYYNGDINITSCVPETMIPSHIKSQFSPTNVTRLGNDSIFVDGVEYVRKDSIENNYF